MIMTLEQLFESWQDWSETTFEQATPLSSLIKAEEEIKEVIDSLSNGTNEDAIIEYADVFMALLLSMRKGGYTVNHLKFAISSKFIINKKRKWKLNENNTYSHE